ncbi:MAG: polyprenyl synthetase family protein [Gammaproteobacteria bacterium]|nr:polyprenyl synthetase family protein [Gammaproteobacteria bacterium]
MRTVPLRAQPPSDATPLNAAAPSAEFAARISACQTRIERVLDDLLRLPDPGTDRLREAMRYSTLGAGKRLRPTLVYLTGQACGAPLARLDAPAAAVELIHVYSLVHDDLPAMDDDDLRRGRPTCHRAFDEGTAVLVGDALQALAFAVLAHEPIDGVTPEARLEMIRVLSRAIGTGGMAGGQAVDLEAVGRKLDVPAIENMHRRKTGALIQASVLLGALAAGVSGAAELAALARFGAEIGLAFQIQDDILDVEGSTEGLGKRAGADAARDKPTYASALGLDAAKARAQALKSRAAARVSALGDRAQILATLAAYVVDRRA